MAKILPDERLVYLAFKNVFKGPEAQMRNDKPIKKKIRKHEKENEEIRALVQEHSVENIANVAKALLAGDIFASTLKAKIRFPEVFDVSPAQSAERAVSEAEAAKIEADAIRNVTVGHGDRLITECLNAEASITKNEEKQPGKSFPIGDIMLLIYGVIPTFLCDQKPVPFESFTARSLYPVYLPMKSQRRLLNKVQDILEHACYTFGEIKMASELQKRGWDSPECVELNIWCKLFRSKEHIFHPERIAALGKSFPDLLESVAQIRHTAVHRLRSTAGRVESFLVDAETLASLFADERCASQLSRLLRETKLVVEEVERNKDVLETQFIEKRKEIAARRAELDRIEHAAYETMLEEDKQYQNFAGANLEDVIDIPETTLHSAAASEINDSEEDTSVESEDEPDFCRVGESF